MLCASCTLPVGSVFLTAERPLNKRTQTWKNPLFTQSGLCMNTTGISLSIGIERIRCLQKTELLRCHWLFGQFIHKYIKKSLNLKWWQLLIQLGVHLIIVGNTFPTYGCSSTSKSTVSTKGGNFLFFFIKEISLFTFSIFPWTPFPTGNLTLCFLQVHLEMGNYPFISLQK